MKNIMPQPMKRMNQIHMPPPIPESPHSKATSYYNTHVFTQQKAGNKPFRMTEWRARNPELKT